MTAKKTGYHIADGSSENLMLPIVSQTMQLLSGKWKLKIVTFLLQHGTTRFTGLQRGVCGISSRVLSKELQELEQDDIISRMVMDPKLTSVVYELTAHGKTLENVIQSIADWGTAHVSHITSRCKHT